ncbi:MAG: nitroreductase family protein [Desulfobacter sp.]|nr:nitroreductase family protein [Desulfobacter sp.]WDP87648.1 MAG: nitroreductase family protein [Desulfobacter sp.]
MDGDPILSLDISGQEKVQAPFFFSDKFYLLESLIKNRRSRRNFVLHPISSQDQQRLFKGLALGWGDSRACLGKVFPHLSLGMVCQNLQGRENGIYLFSKNFSQIHLMKPGDFAPALSKVCLDQGWISRAGIIFLFLSDLDCLEKDRGPRGYREMMMRAGRMAQTIYIMAQSLQIQSLPFGFLPFGACGVGAMYDFEAQALLGLTPKTALVYALAFGPVAEAGG